MMWRPFWQNLFFSLAVFLSLGHLLAAPQTSDEKGAALYLEKLIKIDLDRYQKIELRAKQAPKTLSYLKQNKNWRLSNEEMLSLSLHTPSRFLFLLENSPCAMLALIQTGLAKHAKGPVKTLIIEITSKKDEKPTYGLITASDLLLSNYYSFCQKAEESAELFKVTKVEKTLKNIQFPSPSNEESCKATYESWLTNPFLPFLCAIPEKIRMSEKLSMLSTRDDVKKTLSSKQASEIISEGSLYQSALGANQKFYLKTLCDNLDNKDNFCANFLFSSFWKKLAEGDSRSYLLNKICALLPQSGSTLQICANNLSANPSLCSALGGKRQGGLLPKLHCEDLGNALESSHFNLNFNDCANLQLPPEINNIHRLYLHFRPQPLVETNCTFEAYNSYYKLFSELGIGSEWPLQLCYTNPITMSDEQCLSYVPGRANGSGISEGDILANIIAKLTPTLGKIECSPLEKKSYNPHLLKYKHGCFSLYSENCLGSSCPHKIIFEGREQKGISYKGALAFEYFPLAYVKARKSLHQTLVEALKLKIITIKNFNSIEFFFKEHPKGLIHGQGCLEELLPIHYPRKTLNSCTPHPFIISGTYTKKGDSLLTIHLAAEPAILPRLVDWDQLIQSQESLKRIYPIGQPTMYGLYE